jgi:hypothetical protein
MRLREDEEKSRVNRIRELTREQRSVEPDGEECDVREDAHAANAPARVKRKG